MSLYLDTSALVKLYVSEAGSSDVIRAVGTARLVATSRVAYPEARAALARRNREGALSRDGLRRAVQALDADFGAYVVVEPSERLAGLAGQLAEAEGIRGFDAIHLASAVELGGLTRVRPLFMAFDARLAKAASNQGFQVA